MILGDFHSVFTRFEALGTQDNTGGIGYDNNPSKIVGFYRRLSINLTIRIILLLF